MSTTKINFYLKTQLTLDPPNFFNSAANRLLSPLQSRIEQKKYQSLNGKVTEIPTDTSNSVKKANWIFALFLAGLGLIARGLSLLLSSRVRQAYSDAFLLQIPPTEMPKLSQTEIARYQAVQEDNEKKQQLDKYLKIAISSLKELKSRLSSPGNWTLKLGTYQRDPLYPYPFLLAKNLEERPEIQDLADSALWSEFLTLRQSCFQEPSVEAWDDQELQQRLQKEAIETVRTAFLSNNMLFKQLLKMAENPAPDTTLMVTWLDEQRQNHQYSYPFYTQPKVILIMQQLTKDPRKISPFSETFSKCKTLLESRQLTTYTQEKPPEGAETPLMQAMDRLETIANLEKFIQKINPPK